MAKTYGVEVSDQLPDWLYSGYFWALILILVLLVGFCIAGYCFCKMAKRKFDQGIVSRIFKKISELILH